MLQSLAIRMWYNNECSYFHTKSPTGFRVLLALQLFILTTGVLRRQQSH